jgi:formate dehydrogenase subunit delta
MNVDNLVKMANEIALFYAAEAPHDEAAKNIATHLQRFWEPRMRKTIIEHNLGGGAGLQDVVRDAVKLLPQL